VDSLLVGVSHFAERHENQPVTVSEMLLNLKSLFRNGKEVEQEVKVI